MNYRDFYKNKQMTAGDFKGLIPEGVDQKSFARAVTLENKQLNDIAIAARIVSRNLREDVNYYKKLYEDYEQEEGCCDEHCGECEDDIVGGEEPGNEYDENGGLPKIGGALAVPHVGQPIMMGKIIQVGGIGGGPASGEQSGMTAVQSPGDKEQLTAGGKKVDGSIASKSVGGAVVPGEGQKQGGLNTTGHIAGTSKLNESKEKVRKIVKEVLKEIKYDKTSGKWVKINEETVNMKMGKSYKVVQPRQYKVMDDDTARTNQYEPEITEMYDDEEECMMNERYVELANEQRNLSESELSELKNLREKIDDIQSKRNFGQSPAGTEPNLYEDDKWIQKAVKHPGRCAHPGSPQCPKGSPQYNLAMRFKKGDIHKDNVGEACEDYPCCGHEQGQCPTRDAQGNEVYRCVCGAKLPKNSRSSLCNSCLRRGIEDDDYPPSDNDMQETVDMKMGPSYKTVQPRLYKTSDDDFARKNQYEPDMSEDLASDKLADRAEDHAAFHALLYGGGSKFNTSNNSHGTDVSTDYESRHPSGQYSSTNNGEIDEAGSGDVQHSSYRTVKNGNLPQDSKTRWENDVTEGESKVSKTIAKGQKSKKSTFSQNLKHQKPKKTTSGVHKRKP